MTKARVSRLIWALLVLAMALFILNACVKENTKPEVKVGTVSGIVLQSGRTALAGVSVKIGSRTSFTDSNGKFYIYGINASNSVKVEFSKVGFISNQKIITVKPGQATYVDCSLSMPLQSNFSAAVGSELEDAQTTITIPPNAFVSGSTPFTGNVRAEYRYFDPSDPANINAFPGSFYGERLDGSTTMFESYGYFYASFSDANNPNTQLQLAPGKKASILSYIPGSLAANAPATIPLWYYNESSGKWIEEGVGTNVGSHYQAEVSHFSYWNFDAPITITDQSTLTGRVVSNENSTPISGAQVVATGVDYSGYTRVYSNADGTFSITVKASAQVKLKAYSGLNSSNSTAAISTPAGGGTSSVADLVIEDRSFTLTGKLVNTAGQPMTNAHGMVYEVDPANQQTMLNSWLNVDTEGNFSITTTYDGTASRIKVQFSIMSMRGSLYSDKITFSIPSPGNVYNFGFITMKEGGKLKGRAKNSDGTWMANVYVSFMQEGGQGGEGNYMSSSTDADGYFILTGPPSTRLTQMRGSIYKEGASFLSPLMTLNFPASGAQNNIGTVVFSPATR